jgi:hypothetical protein
VLPPEEIGWGWAPINAHIDRAQGAAEDHAVIT